MSYVQIRRADPNARAAPAARTPATKDGETAAAGDVGLGAGASAAEMTATSTDITAARNIALEKAIGEYGSNCFWFVRVLSLVRGSEISL